MKARKNAGDRFKLLPSLIDKMAVQSIADFDNDITPEIVVLTTFPPRQCGIATYSQDLIKALNNHYVDSFSIKICALENKNEKHTYSDPAVKYILDTSDPQSYKAL